MVHRKMLHSPREYNKAPIKELLTMCKGDQEQDTSPSASNSRRTRKDRADCHPQRIQYESEFDDIQQSNPSEIDDVDMQSELNPNFIARSKQCLS